MTTSRRPTANRRREIAQATLELIAERGLGRFTTAALAQKVGLSSGALFRHFANLDEVVSAAIDRAEEILFEGFPPQDPEPLERLGRFFRQRLEAINSHPEVVRVVYSNELAQAGGDAGSVRVANFRRRSVLFVRSCLQEAKERGLLREHVEPKELSIIVLGSVMALSLSPARHGAERINARPEKVWATIERLIRKDGVVET